jgi:AcrR family transcriptional regulator
VLAKIQLCAGCRSDAGRPVTTALAPSRRSAERRAQLLEAASRAIRAHGPDVSMAAIAAEAGVTKPILYRHFGDKGGLYLALAEWQTEDLLIGIRGVLLSSGTVRERTAATIDAYLTAIERRPDVYRFVVDRASAEDPSVAGQVVLFQQRLAEELAAVIRSDLRLPPARASAWAHAIVGMVRAAGDWWLHSRSVSRERLVRELVDLLFGGFGAGGDGARTPRRAARTRRAAAPE